MRVIFNCWWIVLLLSVFLVNGGFGQKLQHTQSSILFDQILGQQWKGEKALTDMIARFIHNLIVAIKSSSFPTAVAQNISEQCTNDSLLYVHSLYTSLWALQSKHILLVINDRKIILYFVIFYSARIVRTITDGASCSWKYSRRRLI